MLLNSLVVFASRYGLKPSQAYVLPALFECAAKKVGMEPRVLAEEATWRNRPLGEYLAAAARKVATEAPL